MRPSIWMKTIFQKNLQFGDIWPRNRQKIAQIEVFGHFLNFASLVFLLFAHSDRWTWCPVVFLQFFGPINVFLLIFRLEDSYCCFIFYKFSRDFVVLRDFEEILLSIFSKTIALFVLRRSFVIMFYNDGTITWITHIVTACYFRPPTLYISYISYIWENSGKNHIIGIYFSVTHISYIFPWTVSGRMFDHCSVWLKT